MIRLALALLLLALPALAQQPPQQLNPSQVARQMVGVINQWADALEELQKQNAQLQHQLVVVTKERDELKAGTEPKK